MAIIFWIIVFYILYKIIFGFVIPLVAASNAMQARMKSMRQQEEVQQGATRTGFSAEQKPAPPKEDYIDFEEVK